MSAPVKLLGSAEQVGNRVYMRLPRSIDPTRERIPCDPGVTLDEARQMAHRMSLAAHARSAERLTKSTGSKDETVSEWANRWHKYRVDGGIVGTDKEDRSRLENHVFPILGKGRRPIRLVAREEIEAIVIALDEKIAAKRRGLKGGISWKTAHNVWTLVRTMFGDAVNSKVRELRMRSDDPTLGVKPPERGEKKTKAFLYPSEYLALMKAPTIWESSGEEINRARHARRWMRLFTLAIYLQLRAGELRVVRWEDVDLEHWVIHIHKAAVRHTAGKKEKSTKGVLSRKYEIEPAVRPLLLAMHAEASAAQGVKNPKGRIIKVPPESDLSDRLRTYLTLAKCTRDDLHARDAERCPITFHDLRATGITWRTLRDDNPIRVQRAAGHKSNDTTQGYIRTAESLGDGAGEPFPDVPAIVLGNMAPRGRSAKRPKSGPKVSQGSGKLLKLHRKMATPTGIEPAHATKTPSETGRFGPSVPKDRHDRAPSPHDLGPAGRALADALQAAIATGRADDAAELAGALALASVPRRA